jgi:hypothetical protein
VAPHVARGGQPVYQFHRAVVLDLQPLGHLGRPFNANIS